MLGGFKYQVPNKYQTSAKCKAGAIHLKHDFNEPEEVKLIALICAGNQGAFESLYRLYFSRLARFLDSMTRSTTLLEEIINDTMLVVWRRAASFDHSCKVSTWIFSIAYRKALKALKSQDEPLQSDPDLEPGNALHQPEAEFDKVQLRKQLNMALAAITTEQRTVVNLTYYHGMGYEEIAVIMDCPVNTVKTRMFHARRRLKILLAEQARLTS